MWLVDPTLFLPSPTPPPKVEVYKWVKNLCVQLSQFCVRKWVAYRWPVPSLLSSTTSVKLFAPNWKEPMLLRSFWSKAAHYVRTGTCRKMWNWFSQSPASFGVCIIIITIQSFLTWTQTTVCELLSLALEALHSMAEKLLLPGALEVWPSLWRGVIWISHIFSSFFCGKQETRRMQQVSFAGI